MNRVYLLDRRDLELTVRASFSICSEATEFASKLAPAISVNYLLLVIPENPASIPFVYACGEKPQPESADA